MMSDITICNSLRPVLSDCLSLRRQERCLVLCDESCLENAKLFWGAARNMCREALLVMIAGSRKDDFEPGESLMNWIHQFDVALIFTSLSTQENHYQSLPVQKTRIALFPDAASGNFLDTMLTDWAKQGIFTRKCAVSLGNAKTIRVKTDLDTDIVFQNSGSNPLVKDGRITSAGMTGTLPAGQVCIEVNTRTAQGVLALGNSSSVPCMMSIKDGRACKIVPSGNDPDLDRFVSGRQSWRILGRFGVGTLDTVRPDYSFPDRRSRGLVYFEFGLSSGQFNCPLRNFVMENVNVWLDERLWIEQGCYV